MSKNINNTIILSVIFLIAILLFISCRVGRNTKITGLSSNQPTSHPCLSGDPLCISYFDIWQNLQQRENDLTQEYLDEHLKPINAEIVSWNQGANFTVTYNLIDEWVSVQLNDKFPIRIDSSYLPNLNVPTYKEYFDEQDIIYVLENNKQYFTLMLRTINPQGKLQFDSLDEALEFLENKESLNDLQFFRYFITKDGDIKIHSIDENLEKNECIDVYLNLYTGDSNKVLRECIDSHR
ncbi:MAG: hypothetical protein OEX08_02340 [Candidatus Nomurabacteria bacterium]|nr:hypothetical protein [Candidatus Nomurabacteria bacterium]